MKKINDRERTYLFMTLPILALFFCFNTLPLIKGVIYSFTNFEGYGSYDWVGLRNYTDLFQDARVGRSYLFTVKLAVTSTVVVNVLSLILALGLSSKIKFKSALRGMYFIPNILGALVVGYIFNYFFTYILPAMTKTTSMLASTRWAWVAIVAVCAWQSVAMNTIIYISGIQTVPEEVYEAGSIDGATGWFKFRNLTFPSDHALFYHQHGSVHEKFPYGVRSDHGPDQGRSGSEYGIHLLSDLQQRHGRRPVRLPERQRCGIFCPHRCPVRGTDEIRKQ